MIKVLDLFCGAGGLSEGFKKAGFNILTGLDINSDALLTYRFNHPDTEIITHDLQNVPDSLINGLKINNYDIVIGGPPCQGFSLAGRLNKSDIRNKLVFSDFLIFSPVNLYPNSIPFQIE